MPFLRFRPARVPALVAIVAVAMLRAGTAVAADTPAAVDPATLARIRDAAMASDWAYQRLLAETAEPMSARAATR